MTNEEYLDKYYFVIQKAIWDNVSNDVDIAVRAHMNGNVWQKILKIRNRVSDNIWVVRRHTTELKVS